MSSGALYSAEEVAAMLGLHVRTVRNYVRDGRLPAVRIGKQYRIAREDVDKLTGGRATAALSSRVAASRRIEVSAIVQVEGVDPPTMTRLSALVGGAVSSRASGAAPLHVETVYDPQRQVVKVVALGSPDATAGIIGLVGTFVEGGA